jgi:hypothetical protein
MRRRPTHRGPSPRRLERILRRGATNVKDDDPSSGPWGNRSTGRRHALQRSGSAWSSAAECLRSRRDAAGALPARLRRRAEAWEGALCLRLQRGAACGAGGVMARERGRGKGREGAEAVDVDYALRARSSDATSKSTSCSEGVRSCERHAPRHSPAAISLVACRGCTCSAEILSGPVRHDRVQSRVLDDSDRSSVAAEAPPAVNAAPALTRLAEETARIAVARRAKPSVTPGHVKLDADPRHSPCPSGAAQRAGDPGGNESRSCRDRRSSARPRRRDGRHPAQGRQTAPSCCFRRRP